MRVLLISYFFPPFNTIGAVRAGKTAAYLERFGHEVRVISALNQPLQPTLPVEINQAHLIQTSWCNVDWPVELAMGGRRRVAARGFTAGGTGRRSLLSRLGRTYKTLLHVPDGQIGWFPFALRAGSRLLKTWRPDVIYASAMPYTALLVASRLSRRFDIPWVGELRDLWVDHHSYQYPAWRKQWERWLERRTLKTARALVTVSDPLAERLREVTRQPVEVVQNGFDPRDFPTRITRSPAAKPLRLVYTGMAYQGQQDPSPLFAALAQLGPQRSRVRVDFYGRYVGWVRQVAKQHGVDDLIETHQVVPYRDSLRLQREADILILLSWTDPGVRGILTGKLFEYFGARRPILAIGPSHDLPAEMIRERGAGFVSRDPGQIADQLNVWLRKKQTGQGLPDLATAAVVDLTRERQTRRLEQFLKQAITAPGSASGIACHLPHDKISPPHAHNRSKLPVGEAQSQFPEV